jgi:hypothetical protein
MNILGAIVFRAGTWNGQTFTKEDLFGIVDSTIAAGLLGRIPLKFGHDSPLNDGEPAYGWVSRLWVDGDAIKADFTDVPKGVNEAIKNGSYKFCSIELLKNAEYDGAKYPFLLDAIALLGADPPAVAGVSDLQKLAAARAMQGERIMFSMGATDAPATTTQVTVEIDTDGIAADDLGKIAKGPNCTLRLGVGATGTIVGLRVSAGKLLADVEDIGVETAAALKAGRYERIEPKITRSIADGLVLESAKVIGLDVSKPITNARKPLITAGNSRGVPVDEMAELHRRLAAAEGERDQLRADKTKLNYAQQKAIKRKHFEEMCEELENYVRQGVRGVRILPAARLAFRRNFLPDENSAMNVTRAQLRAFAKASNCSQITMWMTRNTAQSGGRNSMESDDKTPVDRQVAIFRKMVADGKASNVFEAMKIASTADLDDFIEIMEHDYNG